MRIKKFKGWVWYVGSNVVGLGSYDPRTKNPPGDDLDDSPFVWNGRVYAECEVGVGCLVQFITPAGDIVMGHIAECQISAAGQLSSYEFMEELGTVRLREGPTVTLVKGSVAVAYTVEVDHD